MSRLAVVSDSQWLAARIELLAKERQLIQLRDELAGARRQLPVRRVEKDYRFDGPHGPVSLLDLFSGRRQLLVQHFMFDPSWDRGCPYCSRIAAEYSSGTDAQLAEQETAFAAVSRAPYDKIAAYRDLRGWTFPWYSSYHTDFNYDFYVSHDESVRPLFFDYMTRSELEAAGTPGLGSMVLKGAGETAGFSCFLRDGQTVYHTYSTYGDLLLGRSNELLDLTYLGRQVD